MRDFDPTTGRYFQADPLGLVDGASVYGYALQNPGRYVDPTGELVPAIVPAIIAGVYAGGWNVALNFVFAYANEECYTYGDAISDFSIGFGSAASVVMITQGVGVGQAASAVGRVGNTGATTSRFVPPTLAQQAANLVSANGGRARVTLRSQQNMYRIDLTGKAHRGVATPHTVVAGRNWDAPGSIARYNTSEKNINLHSTTQTELRWVRRYLERRN